MLEASKSGLQNKLYLKNQDSEYAELRNDINRSPINLVESKLSDSNILQQLKGKKVLTR